MTSTKAIIVLGGAVLAGAVTAWALATVAFPQPLPAAMRAAPGIRQPEAVHEQACPWATLHEPATPQGSDGHASQTCPRTDMNADMNPSCEGHHPEGMMMLPGMMDNRMQEGMSGCMGMQAACRETGSR